MSSKIKVDTIENVAGSGNVSLGSGHNLVVPGNITGQGTTTLTGDLTVDTSTLKVDSSNNRVGIGTTSPGQPLQVESTSNAKIRLAYDATRYAQIGRDSTGHYEFASYEDGATIKFGTVTGSSGSTNTRMIIDASGYVTTPSQVSFIAAGTNGAYINTSPIPFPAVSQNVGNGYNNSNYTFTAPIAGTYLFHLHLGLTQGHNNNQLYPYMAINGSNSFYTYQSINASTAHGNAHMTQLLALSANDTVKINFVTSGSSAQYYNNSPECRFMGYLLG